MIKEKNVLNPSKPVSVSNTNNENIEMNFLTNEVFIEKKLPPHSK